MVCVNFERGTYEENLNRGGVTAVCEPCVLATRLR